MKKLKNVLKEAMSREQVGKLLFKRRNKAKGASGPVASYIITLENVVEFLAQTSNKSNKHLQKFLKQWDDAEKRREQMGLSPEKQLQSPELPKIPSLDQPEDGSSKEEPEDTKPMPSMKKVAKDAKPPKPIDEPSKIRQDRLAQIRKSVEKKNKERDGRG